MFQQVFGKDFTEKMTFNQKLEDDEAVGIANI